MAATVWLSMPMASGWPGGGVELRLEATEPRVRKQLLGWTCQGRDAITAASGWDSRWREESDGSSIARRLGGVEERSSAKVDEVNMNSSRPGGATVRPDAKLAKRKRNLPERAITVERTRLGAVDLHSTPISQMAADIRAAPREPQLLSAVGMDVLHESGFCVRAYEVEERIVPKMGGKVVGMHKPWSLPVAAAWT
ncbi:hypothetical protein CCMA1212_003366 [Trichoderma ghanense]|uniref:Uncharacterized protein n=1 Tax=Trichoderma ghanense TaxID=65468 RepID=A0ABY2H904_9HYPO